jgi:two-component system, NtrC family, nitrogen regulation response regulator GlnG
LGTWKKKVLIVDDEEDLTWSIVRGLSKDRSAVEVHCASSGLGALDLMVRNEYDLLVTDMRMPGLDGKDLVRRVRSMRPALKIILMTAFPSPDVREFASRYRVDETVEKPFEMGELRRLIGSHLDMETMAAGRG